MPTTEDLDARVELMEALIEIAEEHASRSVGARQRQHHAIAERYDEVAGAFQAVARVVAQQRANLSAYESAIALEHECDRRRDLQLLPGGAS